jgi:hypothetical protein
MIDNNPTDGVAVHLPLHRGGLNLSTKIVHRNKRAGTRFETKPRYCMWIERHAIPPSGTAYAVPPPSSEGGY